MKTFKGFMLEDGGAAGGAGGAGTSTTGVAGAGDNPQKIVPVTKRKQKTYQQRGAEGEKTMVKTFSNQMRKILP